MRTLKGSATGLVWLFIFLCTIITSSAWGAKSASIVICAETGKVYSSSNPDVITHPASLTKMMTLYLTFQALREGKFKMDQKIPVSKHATKQEPSNLWLKQGTSITVRQAILGLVTKSANDAAVVLAEALGKGSEPHFAKLMTQKARNLGMAKTIFKNASGLPNKQQITTARDMATLSRALYLHFPEYFKFFKEKEFAFKGTVHKNHNHLLGKVKGVDGIKTGFTCASGFNLAASMVRDNRRIIAVVLGGESIKARDKKMTHLLEATHASLQGQPLPQKKGKYASIGDLIHTIDTSSQQTQQAVYLSQTGDVKSLDVAYNSLDALFNDIAPPQNKTKPKVNKNKNKKKKKKRA